MSYNPDRTSVSDYDVTWGSYFLDVVDEVDPSSLVLVTKPIKVGSVGDVKLGERIIGIEGEIKVAVRSNDPACVNGLTPWGSDAGVASPGTGAVSLPLIPLTFKTDLYSFAKTLRLHPNNRSDTLMDIVLKKATPRIVPLGKRDGVADDVNLMIFSFFPIRTKLTSGTPQLDYGYIGSTDPNP